MFFCGVFDGHGPAGHRVSHYVRDFLPAKISQLYRDPTAADDDEDNNDDEDHNPLLRSWKARLTRCFHDMDDQLEKESSVECYCSGTTSVCVLKKVVSLFLLNY